MTLPNILTLVRIVITPILFMSMRYDVPWISVALYLTGLSTDFMDGHIARSRGLTSAFGRSMDSVADKALVMTALYGLVIWQKISYVWLFLFIFREFMILGVRGIRTSNNSTLAEINDVLGRVRFFVMHLGILLLIFPHISRVLDTLGTGLISIALFISYIVFIHYIYRYRRQLIDTMHPKALD